MSRSGFRGRAREGHHLPSPCFQTKRRPGWPRKFFWRSGPSSYLMFWTTGPSPYRYNFSWMSMSIAFMIIVVKRLSSEFFSYLCSWRGLHLSIFNVDRERQWMVILLEIVAFLLSFYPITLQVLPSCYKQSTIYHTLTEWMPLFGH